MNEETAKEQFKAQYDKYNLNDLVKNQTWHIWFKCLEVNNMISENKETSICSCDRYVLYGNTLYGSGITKKPSRPNFNKYYDIGKYCPYCGKTISIRG